MTHTCTLYENRLRTILEHVFKIRNGLLPPVDPSLFIQHQTEYNLRHHNAIELPTYKYKKYGFNSLKYQGGKLWNDMPDSLRLAVSLKDFKELLREWDMECDCNTCIMCKMSNV